MQVRFKLEKMLDDRSMLRRAILILTFIFFAGWIFGADSYFALAQKIVLKKNMIKGKNVLTQEMVKEPCATYLIKYVFDLQGKHIEMPKDCKLVFTDKGKLVNGILSGNVSNKYLRPEWFGASASQIVDSRQAIQNCINLCKETRLSGTYYCLNTKVVRDERQTLSSQIRILPGKTLKGEQGSLLYKVTPDSNWESGFTMINACQGSTIDGVNFKATNLNIKTWTGRNDALISVYSDSVTIQNCTFDNLLISAIKATPTKNIKILNNRFYDCDCGFIMQGASKKDVNLNLRIENNVFIGKLMPYSEPISLYDTCGKDIILSNISIIGNHLSNKKFSGGIFVGIASGATKRNVLIANNVIENCGGISCTNAENVTIRNNQITNTIGCHPLGLFNCHDAYISDCKISCYNNNLQLSNSYDITADSLTLNRLDSTKEDAYLNIHINNSHNVTLSHLIMTRNSNANVGIKVDSISYDITMDGVQNDKNKLRIWDKNTKNIKLKNLKGKPFGDLGKYMCL